MCGYCGRRCVPVLVPLDGRLVIAYECPRCAPLLAALPSGPYDATVAAYRRFVAEAARP